ncbi:hypothetical protein [Streptomyces sp. 4F14]|uniref:hypothetical protein n=1 Tax=Streptomyces sp. 4F14 TaxID=3394380 RepID=UPI003A8A39CD
MRDRAAGRTGYRLIDAGLGPAVVTDPAVRKRACRQGDVIRAGHEVHLVLYESVYGGEGLVASSGGRG